jgi:hypothetical protein
MFQNGITIVGVVCHGASINDVFSACQRAFLSKNSSCNCHCVQYKCHDIPGSQSLALRVRNWSHGCHRFSMIREAINIIHHAVLIWLQVTTIKKILLTVDSNQILRLCKQQGHNFRHKAPSSSKMVSKKS